MCISGATAGHVKFLSLRVLLGAACTLDPRTQLADVTELRRVQKNGSLIGDPTRHYVICADQSGLCQLAVSASQPVLCNLF